MEKTTIQVNLSTLQRLKLFRNYERQSYDELLNKILDEAESNVLNDKEIVEIGRAHV